MPVIDSAPVVVNVTVGTPADPPAPAPEVGAPALAFLSPPDSNSVSALVTPRAGATHSSVFLIDPAFLAATPDRNEIQRLIDAGLNIPRVVDEPTDPNDPSIPVFKFDFQNLTPGATLAGVAFSSKITE